MKKQVNWPFYKITKDKKIAYILGTIHVGEVAMYPFPNVITEAILNSSQIITEVSNDEFMQASQILLRFTENAPSFETLRPQLTDENEQKLLRLLLEYKIDETTLNNSAAWLVPTLFSNTVTNHATLMLDYGVDEVILQQAKQYNIQSIGIESAIEQFTLLQYHMPNDPNEMVSSLSPLQNELENLSTLLKSYQDNSIEYATEMLESTDEALSSERNKAWLPNMIHIINAEDQPFFAFGWLHLFGDEGLIQLLKNEGFEVLLYDFINEAYID